MPRYKIFQDVTTRGGVQKVAQIIDLKPNDTVPDGAVEVDDDTPLTTGPVPLERGDDFNPNLRVRTLIVKGN